MVCRDWKEMSFEKSSFGKPTRGCLVTGRPQAMADTSPVVPWNLRHEQALTIRLLRPTTHPRRARTTGATTLREQLVTSGGCDTRQCHNKIDPVSPENFDAIGAWREKYDRNWKSIHPETPGGQTFSSFEELGSWLL